MNIVIPSRGRAGNMRVLDFLPSSVRPHVFVPHDERDEYRAWVGDRCEVHALSYTHIGDKRQQILDYFQGTKIIMLDDDLRFRKRMATDKVFATATKGDVERMLRMLNLTLDSTPHAGIPDEFMCQHQPRGHKFGGRYNQVLAYNFALCDGPAPRFRLAINEEHDMHLQLLRMGHVPILLTDWTKGSRYNAIGGCSTWRTPEFELAQFRAFEAMWPGVVSLRPSKNSLCGWSTAIAWRKVGKS